MLIEKIFESGSLEWLEARNKNITATEVSALFGLSKYNNPKKLLQSKLAPQKIWSKYLRRGRVLEPAVLKAVREDLKWRVSPHLSLEEFCEGLRNAAAITENLVRRLMTKLDEGVYFYQHEDHQLSATPDAVRLDTEFEIDALIELKSASDVRLDDWDFCAPHDYLLQVHTQMLCVGVDKAYVAGLGAFDPFPLIVYEVVWDERINKQILQEVDRWWECFDKGVEFVVEKDRKADMKALLESNVRRVY